MWQSRLVLTFTVGLLLAVSRFGQAQERPNILVIMADDAGYSDIGCFGSEINTSNLDKLAAEGVRFTQFYNTARCCPSRATLMTGLYSHQAGVGDMLGKTEYPGYQTKLSTDSVTMAEVLKDAGYRTYITGKWHLSGAASPDGPKDGWPMQRGFEKFYGTIKGGGNYYNPAALCRGNNFISVENDPQYQPESFYYTDAITDNSIMFLDEHSEESPEKPFLMYVAYTAPHWPLHAPEEEILKYDGKYDAGYDAIRKARFEKMKELGIIESSSECSPTVGDWSKIDNKASESQNMETYAAMVTCMDKGIGKLVEKLKATGKLDNTIIIYMQDNGSSAETISPKRRNRSLVTTSTDVTPGGPNTYLAYGENWANVSNTPYRLYKKWVHEGGISTPLIFHWPKGVASPMKNSLVREPGHLIDVMPTVLDATDTTYPETYKGNRIAPMAGISLLSLVQGNELERNEPIFWEHQGHRAVRNGKWKLVSADKDPWELYDMSTDRVEMKNLAKINPGIVKAMAEKWQAWAKENDVLRPKTR